MVVAIRPIPVVTQKGILIESNPGICSDLLGNPRIFFCASNVRQMSVKRLAFLASFAPRLRLAFACNNRSDTTLEEREK